MTRKEASRILGLSPDSSEIEIRKAFKKLALKYHPDVNPSAAANEQFLAIKRAMETLLAPEPAIQVDESKRPSRKSSGTESAEEIQERLKQARERFQRQQAYKQQQNDAYFNKLTNGLRWRLFKTVALVGLFLSLFMSLETILPHHFEEDVLLGCSKANYSGISKRHITAIELENRGRYYTNFNRGIWVSTYPEVTIETTWFLHTPIYMYNTDDFERYRTDFDFHSGSIHWGLVVLFLVPLMTWFYKRKTLYFVMLYHFSLWIIGSIVLYQLFTQERLLHIISLGFY